MIKEYIKNILKEKFDSVECPERSVCGCPLENDSFFENIAIEVMDKLLQLQLSQTVREYVKYQLKEKKESNG